MLTVISCPLRSELLSLRETGHRMVFPLPGRMLTVHRQIGEIPSTAATVLWANTFGHLPWKKL